MTVQLPDPGSGVTDTGPTARSSTGRSPGASDAEDSARQKPADLSANVRRGAFWDALRTLILRVTNIAITAVVAHILTRHDFGVFAVALTAYMLVNTFAKAGAGYCLMRADFDIDALAPTMVSVSLVAAAGCAAVTFIFAPNIAIALGSADATDPIRVMALVLLLEGFSAIPWSQLSRDFRQDRQFLANAISFIPAQVVLVLLATLGYGAMAFAWSTVVNQAITAALVFAFAPTRYFPGFSRSALSPLWRFGIPLAGAGFVSYILLNVDYAFVGRLIGPVQLGVYMLAFSVASWPMGLIGGAVLAVSMPAFSRIKHDPDLLKNAIFNALRVTAAIVMPICGLMIVLARPLVLTLYGARWSASAEVLSVLSLYSAAAIVCTLFGMILSSLGKTKAFVAVQLLWLGALIPAMALGVRHAGINGAAEAHVVVIALIVLPGYLVTLRRTTAVHLASLLRATLPAVLAATAAALVARAVAAQLASPAGQLLAGLAAGGLIYMAIACREVAVALLNDDQLARLRAIGLFRVFESAIGRIRLPARGRTGGLDGRREADSRATAADSRPLHAGPPKQPEQRHAPASVSQTDARSGTR